MKDIAFVGLAGDGRRRLNWRRRLSERYGRNWWSDFSYLFLNAS
jgi:hypothetical protein